MSELLDEINLAYPRQQKGVHWSKKGYGLCWRRDEVGDVRWGQIVKGIKCLTFDCRAYVENELDAHPRPIHPIDYKVELPVRSTVSGEMGIIKSMRAQPPGFMGGTVVLYSNPNVGHTHHPYSAEGRYELFELALPRAGEWWMVRECEKHHYLVLGHVQMAVDIEAVWQNRVLCGCLYPIYYGKGFKKEPKKPDATLEMSKDMMSNRSLCDLLPKWRREMGT
jgi:hypothetical protein